MVVAPILVNQEIHVVQEQNVNLHRVAQSVSVQKASRETHLPDVCLLVVQKIPSARTIRIALISCAKTPALT